MAGRVEGKVAFITGVARGQGRSHAVRLAEEGADIIGIDNCADVDTVDYAGATPDDLDETVRLVEKTGRRMLAYAGDVRDAGALRYAVDRGVEELGRLDIVSANAGIFSRNRLEDLSEDQWSEMVDINLSGVWRTCKFAIPHLVRGGRGGSIVITSSGAGLRGHENIGHYAAAKHGLVGLMRSMALELAPQMIRVNSVHPTTVDTPMISHDTMYRLLRPDLDAPTKADVVAPMTTMNALPIPWIESVDVSNAVLFLASDEARYITGVALPVDAGCDL